MEICMDNKKALVTGGTRDIGRVIVETLVKCGAEVYALGNDKDNMDKLLADIPSVKPVLVELADWDATRKAVLDIGAMDMLVNNAGTLTELKPFVDVKKEEFEENFQINMLAAANISQVVAKSILESGKGRAIVNVSSVSTTVMLSGWSAYNISKGALDVMTKCMATELAPTIRVNGVNPTIVNTPLSVESLKDETDPLMLDPWKNRHPLKRYAEMQDVADVVAYLLSDKASYVSGVCIPIGGAFSCS